jgi:hypothetical protein
VIIVVDTGSRPPAATAPSAGAPASPPAGTPARSAGTPASSAGTPAPGAGTPAHSARFDAAVEEIRRRYLSDVYFAFRRPENWIRRRLGLPYYSVRASVVMGLVGVASRLGLALLASALAGDWARVNWAGWAIVLGFYAFVDSIARLATPPLDEPPRPEMKRMVDDAMALLPTLAHESDAEELAAFARRWTRLSTAAVGGALVTVTTLGAAWLLMPDALSRVAAGTLVLVAITLFDFGAITATPVEWALMTREARYDHDLFWASPADSPEVDKATSTYTGFAWATGLWMTFYMILTIVLVSWRSPLVFPIAAGFTVFGSVTVILTTFGIRASIQKIVLRARERELAPLRERIAALDPRTADLSAGESEQLNRLLDLYASIRDAPVTISAGHALLHTAAGLLVPTVMFLISVSGEVYAERILDSILP